jgi:hypothetical protein
MAVDLFAELLGLLAELDARSTPYALCGAFALAVYGVPRATKDIDILALPRDLEHVREAARARGFKHEALPMTFSKSAIQVQRFTKIADGRPIMLDVLLVDGALGPIWNDRIKLPLGDRDVWVVSRDGLVTLKITAGRPQDLVDVQRLSEVEHGEG